MVPRSLFQEGSNIEIGPFQFIDFFLLPYPQSICFGKQSRDPRNLLRNQASLFLIRITNSAQPFSIVWMSSLQVVISHYKQYDWKKRFHKNSPDFSLFVEMHNFKFRMTFPKQLRKTRVTEFFTSEVVHYFDVIKQCTEVDRDGLIPLLKVGNRMYVSSSFYTTDKFQERSISRSSFEVAVGLSIRILS